MNKPAVALGAICIGLGISCVVLGISAHRLRNELQLVRSAQAKHAPSSAAGTDRPATQLVLGQPYINRECVYLSQPGRPHPSCQEPPPR